jgi:hypothetical protein
MALEEGTYIDSLVSSNPTAADNVAQGDDHIRLIKSTISNTFPNLTGAVSASHSDLNAVVETPANRIKGNVTGVAGPTTNITKTAMKDWLSLSDYALAGHLHTDTYAPLAHTHDIGDIQGEVPVNQLPKAATGGYGVVRLATNNDMNNARADRVASAQVTKTYVDDKVEDYVNNALTPKIITVEIPPETIGWTTVSVPHGFGRVPKLFTVSLVNETVSGSDAIGTRFRVSKLLSYKVSPSHCTVVDDLWRSTNPPGVWKVEFVLLW